MLSASIVSFLLEKIHHFAALPVYLLVGALVFGETALFLGFLFPGETAVIVAGVVASQGRVNVVVLCLVVVSAAALGECVGFYIGARFGEDLFGLPFLRTRRTKLESALEGLRQRGAMYVFIGRFTAFFRAVMPALAGMSRMDYRRFLVANVAGATLWGVGYTLLGYFAGGALNQIERSASWVGIAVLVAMVALFITYHFVKRRRAASRPPDSAQRVE
ncbi:MAG: DedA family protein [Acidimicrobiales bacterium]|jgi:membrane protein DedA with SNARE-associated domain